MFDRVASFIDRHWRLLLLLAWALLGAWLIFARWNYITGFVLADTDDNMRISQVRALLAGQDWFDLRQYKMNWPEGANIHWSRLVDLPIAGLILLGRMFMTGPHAEQMAVAVAPLLPLLLLFVSLTLIVRRLVAPAAWPLAVVCLFFATSTMGMFQPTRIDHHNWQLALLALAAAGIADPRRARGGAWRTERIVARNDIGTLEEDVLAPADSPPILTVHAADGSTTHLATPRPDQHAFHRELADRIRFGLPMSVTGAQSRRVLAVLEAAAESAADEGRPVIPR